MCFPEVKFRQSASLFQTSWKWNVLRKANKCTFNCRLHISIEWVQKFTEIVTDFLKLNTDWWCSPGISNRSLELLRNCMVRHKTFQTLHSVFDFIQSILSKVWNKAAQDRICTKNSSYAQWWSEKESSLENTSFSLVNRSCITAGNKWIWWHLSPLGNGYRDMERTEIQFEMTWLSNTVLWGHQNPVLFSSVTTTNVMDYYFFYIHYNPVLSSIVTDKINLWARPEESVQLQYTKFCHFP